MKTAILAVSFGTSHNQTRRVTIEALEQTLSRAYPRWEMRRAFTSQRIIEKLAQRDGLKVDSVKEALERLAAEGFQRVYVQPTHVIKGFEYDEIAAEVECFGSSFESIRLGAPLLSSVEDFDAVVYALAKEYSPAADEALLLMGHGTEHHADTVYPALDYHFKAEGYRNIFVGTVEGYPSLEQVLPFVQEAGYQKVTLAPLLVVAGDHTAKDMAGDGEDSWKSILTRRGYQVTCHVRGLGEIAAIREIYLNHLQAIAEK